VSAAVIVAGWRLARAAARRIARHGVAFAHDSNRSRAYYNTMGLQQSTALDNGRGSRSPFTARSRTAAAGGSIIPFRAGQRHQRGGLLSQHAMPISRMGGLRESVSTPISALSFFFGLHFAAFVRS